MSFAVSAAAVSVLATVAGAGLSFYGLQQQASNASRIANYNAQLQRANADRQAQIARYQAQQNAAIAESQYRQGLANAEGLRMQAKAQEAQGREKAARLRAEQERMLGLQRGKFAASGVTNEGSPLEVLADTARLTELNIQDSAYETELERQKSLQQAAIAERNAGFSLIDANMSRFDEMTASTARSIAYRDADLTRLAGESSASGYRTGSYASLISGAGQLAGGVSDFKYRMKGVS